MVNTYSLCLTQAGVISSHVCLHAGWANLADGAAHPRIQIMITPPHITDSFLLGSPNQRLGNLIWIYSLAARIVEQVRAHV